MCNIFFFSKMFRHWVHSLALRCQEIFCHCFISIISCVSSIILALCSLPTVAQLVATPAINLQLASSQTIFNLLYTCRPGSCKHYNHTTTVLYSEITVELDLLQSQYNFTTVQSLFLLLTWGAAITVIYWAHCMNCNHCMNYNYCNILHTKNSAACPQQARAPLPRQAGGGREHLQQGTLWQFACITVIGGAGTEHLPTGRQA